MSRSLPVSAQGIQVEGTGPGVSNHAQIAGCHLFVTGAYAGHRIGGEKDPKRVGPSALQTGDMVDLVEVVPARGWTNLPDSQRPPLEAELIMRPLGGGGAGPTSPEERSARPSHTAG
jgi:hypothetical protein